MSPQNRVKILEIIQLRSAAGPLEAMCKQIGTSIHATDETSGVVAIYRRSGLETDLAIHIHRSATLGTVGPSDLGLRLASELESHGLVDHTVWEELR